MRYVRLELGRLLGLADLVRMGPFEADSALKRALSTEFRLIIIDEAQWLNRECFEYLRHLDDDVDTRFALLFVGGDGCYEVLRREPMLDSLLYAHQRFAPLLPAEVLAAVPAFHPIYEGVDPDLVRLVNDTCGHDNLRSWARFTCHAARLCDRTRRTVCDEEIARNAFRTLGGGRGR